MKHAADIYPGWKMTVRQHGLYFRLLAAACAAQHATTAAAKEALRQAAHLAAFGKPKSAKDINRTNEFDAIATELKRVANVINDPQSPEHKRSVYVATQRLAALQQIASPNYTATLLRDRFKVIAGQRSIEDLTAKQLAELISTVNNRIQMLAKSRKAETVEVETANENVPF